MSWCQIPEDTFRALVEYLPHWIKAALVAQGDLHNIRQMVSVLFYNKLGMQFVIKYKIYIFMSLILPVSISGVAKSWNLFFIFII